MTVLELAEPPPPHARRTVVICAVCMLIDGFNSQVIAFVAPALAQTWRLRPEAVGLLISAGLAGAAVGGGLLSWLGDVWGRRRVIAAGVALFTAMTVLTGFAASPLQAGLLRLLTGVGLGVVVPNAIALCAESSPAPRRNFTVTAMFCGFPLGGALAGVLCTPLTEAYGWRAAFFAGAAISILVLPLAAFGLPRAARVRAAETLGGARIRLAERLAALRIGPTVLLCVTSFLSLLLLNTLVNWTPSILRIGRFDPHQAAGGAVALNVGAVGGALLIGRLMDRRGAEPVIAVAFTLGGALLLLAPRLLGSPAATLGALFGLGAIVIGAQFGVTALAAEVFPARSRALGIGVNFTFGQMGSIAGPIIGGVLLQSGLATGSLLALGALPAFGCALAIAALAWLPQAGWRGSAATVS